MDSETNRILPVAVQYYIFVALCHFVLQYVEIVIQLWAEYAKLVVLIQRLIEVFFFLPSIKFGLRTLDVDETVAFKFKMWSIFLIHVNIFVVRIGLIIELIKDLLGSWQCKNAVL